MVLKALCFLTSLIRNRIILKVGHHRQLLKVVDATNLMIEIKTITDLIILKKKLGGP